VRLASFLLPCAALAAIGLYALSGGGTSAVRPLDAVLPPLDDRISLRTPADAERMRLRLRRYVFGSTALPSTLPTVERDVTDSAFTEGLPELARLDRLTTRMPLGFESVAYHAVPRRSNSVLLVYHHGHSDVLDADRRTLAHFLGRGYTLLVFSMPLVSPNSQPANVSTPCGRVRLEHGDASTYHDALGCLPFPIRYFVEPVAAGLNYTERFGYRLTAMAGLSGGGWTTTLYAALDRRIRMSYPVAGSRPHYVSWRDCGQPRSIPRCLGDFEQREPGLYRIANHLELYALGAVGEGRRQLAIYNRYELCCFAGTSHLEWEPRVKAAVERLGSGSFDVVGDTTHRDHIVSAFSHRVIEDDLQRALAATGPS
jgi:hypothetical protein